MQYIIQYDSSDAIIRYNVSFNIIYHLMQYIIQYDSSDVIIQYNSSDAMYHSI